VHSFQYHTKFLQHTAQSCSTMCTPSAPFTLLLAPGARLSAPCPLHSTPCAHLSATCALLLIQYTIFSAQ
jgi:hypothetical protein